jgi:outer membrane receptor protein involved in Fe transport
MENDFRTHGEHSAIDDEEPLPPRPLSAAFEAAELAVQALAADLSSNTVRNTLPKSLAFARAAIRIEVVAYEALALMSAFTHEEMERFNDPGYVGPASRNGVAVYVVPWLAEECGWRVVNPADAQ